MDKKKKLKQLQAMQAQMAKAQEELAGETVEASAGGGMVRVKATGAGEVVEVKIAPEAIDPEDPEMLEDLVVAAVNQALRNAQDLMQSKLGGATGGPPAARPPGPRPAAARAGGRGTPPPWGGGGGRRLAAIARARPSPIPGTARSSSRPA